MNGEALIITINKRSEEGGDAGPGAKDRGRCERPTFRFNGLRAKMLSIWSPYGCQNHSTHLDFFFFFFTRETNVLDIKGISKQADVAFLSFKGFG